MVDDGGNWSFVIWVNLRIKYQTFKDKRQDHDGQWIKIKAITAGGIFGFCVGFDKASEYSKVGTEHISFKGKLNKSSVGLMRAVRPGLSLVRAINLTLLYGLTILKCCLELTNAN